MVAVGESGDEGRPRVDVVIEEAVVDAAEGDEFEEAPGSAVGAAGGPVRGVHSVPAADEAGLLVNERERPLPGPAGGAVEYTRTH